MLFKYFRVTFFFTFFFSIAFPPCNYWNSCSVTRQRSSEEVHQENVTLLEKNFYDFVSGKIASKITERIPKCIHLIWLGKDPLPLPYSFCVNSWKQIHPDWEVKIWNDSDLKNDKTINFTSKYPQVNHVAMKSDIARYEILYNYGGIYADTDFYCVKKFNEVVENCDFFTGLGVHGHLMFNGIIGSSKKNDFIKKLLDNLQEKKELLSSARSGNQILAATGPDFLTAMLLQEYKDNKNFAGVVFPPTVFYSFPSLKRFDFWSGKLGLHEVKKHLFPESLATHLWATSWSYKKRLPSLPQILRNLGFPMNYPLLVPSDKEVQGPLVKACSMNRIQEVRLLLRCSLPYRQRTAALEIAKRKKYVAIVDELQAWNE